MDPERKVYQVPYTEVRTYDFKYMADAMLNNAVVTIGRHEGRIQSLSKVDDKIKVTFDNGSYLYVNAR